MPTAPSPSGIVLIEFFGSERCGGHGDGRQARCRRGRPRPEDGVRGTDGPHPHDRPATMSGDLRVERDLLGEVPVPASSLHGAHTERALEGSPAAARCTSSWPAPTARQARLRAHQPKSEPQAQGQHDGVRLPPRARRQACSTSTIVVDRLQGGAGTSANMERQRSARQPRAVAPRRAAGALSPDLSPGPCQPASVHQRRLPHGPAHGRHHAAARLEETHRPAGGAAGEGAGVRPHRRSAAPRSRTPCSSPWGRRWPPRPRRSTGTGGGSASARSGCAR